MFGLVAISNKSYQEYLHLKDNPTVIPMYGPPEPVVSEIQEVVVHCRVSKNYGVTTSKLKGATNSIDTYSDHSFVSFIQDSLQLFRPGLKLDNNSKEQLYKVYNLTKDVVITYVDYNIKLVVVFKLSS